MLGIGLRIANDFLCDAVLPRTLPELQIEATHHAAVSVGLLLLGILGAKLVRDDRLSFWK